MSLNESTLEDAALTWFLLRPSYAKASAGKRGSGGQVGDPPSPHLRLRRTGLGYAVGHLPAPRSATWQAGGPQLAPGEAATEPAFASYADRRESFGEVVLVGRLREAIRRPAVAGPPIPCRTLATLRDTLLPKLLSGELSVTALDEAGAIA